MEKHTVIHRYKDFRNLQQCLVEFSKTKGISIPELPNRGNLNALISKFDPRLIEYRKFALKNYLQGLLQLKQMFKCNQFMEFLEIKYSIC